MKKMFIIFLSLAILTISKSYCYDYSGKKNETVNEKNLLKNGDFSDSLKNWILIGPGVNPYHPTDPGRADFIVKNGELEVKIKNKGTGIYSVMIYQPVMLKKDSTYITSFYAKSDSISTLISNFTQDVSWVNFSGDQEFKLSNTMTKYTYEFKMTRDCEVLFQFCLGGKGTGSIFLDSLVVNVKPSGLTGMDIQKTIKPGIHIYPNPACEQFSVEAGGQYITKVEVLNVAGQLVDSQISYSKQVSFYRKKLPGGAYFCKAFTDNDCLVGKFLLKD